MIESKGLHPNSKCIDDSGERVFVVGVVQIYIYICMLL